MSHNIKFNPKIHLTLAELHSESLDLIDRQVGFRETQREIEHRFRNDPTLIEIYASLKKRKRDKLVWDFLGTHIGDVYVMNESGADPLRADFLSFGEMYAHRNDHITLSTGKLGTGDFAINVTYAMAKLGDPEFVPDRYYGKQYQCDIFLVRDRWEAFKASLLATNYDAQVISIAAEIVSLRLRLLQSDISPRKELIKRELLKFCRSENHFNRAWKLAVQNQPALAKPGPPRKKDR